MTCTITKLSKSWTFISHIQTIKYNPTPSFGSDFRKYFVLVCVDIGDGQIVWRCDDNVFFSKRRQKKLLFSIGSLLQKTPLSLVKSRVALLSGVWYSSFPIIAACLEVRAGCHEVSSRVYVMRTEYSQHMMIMMKMVSTRSGDEAEVRRSEWGLT